MAVNTKQVGGRRKLELHSFDEILAECERLSRVPVQSLGNWSLGQCFEHLAAAVRMALDGAPFEPPWWLKKIGPWLKRRFVYKPMAAGFQLPRRAQKLFPAPGISTADGLASLRQAIERFRREPQRHPHSVIGPLTDAEWEQLHCRHAELHLSYQIPQGAT